MTEILYVVKLRCVGNKSPVGMAGREASKGPVIDYREEGATKMGA